MTRRVKRSASLALAALLAGFAGCSSKPELAVTPVLEISRGRNPVFAAADPHLSIADGRWWIHATTPREAGEPARPRFYAWSSSDLRSWRRHGPVFSFDGVDWIDDDGAPKHTLWAPAIAESGGRFFLYYSVGPQNPTPSRIGVAVGDTPQGPFRDSGRPLITGGNGFEAIDPMVFKDPRSKTVYLYAGGSAGSTLRVWELNPDMVSLKREVPVPQPPGFTEGPFMHERNGVYYLSWSQGNWDRPNYRAHYATAPSPVGPWTYRGVLLSSDERRGGPGHHSIVRRPGTDDWFIAYHRWEASGPGPFTGDRQVAVQPLVHNPDGTIQPIRMGAEPPPSAPLGRRSAAQAGRGARQGRNLVPAPLG